VHHQGFSHRAMLLHHCISCFSPILFLNYQVLILIYVKYASLLNFVVIANNSCSDCFIRVTALLEYIKIAVPPLCNASAHCTYVTKIDVTKSFIPSFDFSNEETQLKWLLFSKIKLLRAE